MSKTTRIPKAYAGEGSVRQQGPLPLYRCNDCGDEVVWVASKRTGRKYLANVSKGYNDQRFYMGANVHKCAERQQEIAEAIQKDREATAVTEMLVAAQAATKRGDRDEAVRIATMTVEEWMNQ